MIDDKEDLADSLEHRLTYTGRPGPLFIVFYTNLVLTVLSLGIYRFWAKVRMRRYLWSSVLFQNEPYEYTGRGLELFMGFLKVLGVIIVPLLVVLHALTIFSPIAAAGGLGLFIMIGVMSPYIVFWVRRYRLNRSSWRGIRFQQTGSAASYARKAILGWFLSIITVFFYVPYNVARLLDYQINHIYFGTTPFQYSGTSQDISPAFRWIWFSLLLVGLFSFACLGYVGYMSYMLMKSMHTTSPQALMLAVLSSGKLASFLIAVIGSYLFVILSAVIARLKYRLLMYRSAVNFTSIGSMHAVFTATFWQFFRFSFGNFFIKALSLGLLTPLVLHRRMKFLCRHIKMYGLPNFNDVQQVPGLGKAGEGWTHWLDVDALDF